VSRQFDIVGLTLAEVALVLLFAFLVLFVPAYARLNRRVKQSGVVDVANLKTDLKNAIAENERLKSQIDKSRRNLRSAAMPTCAELNKADWLFTAVIRGADVYEVNGNKYSLNTLLQAYAAELSEASKNGCRHRVKLYYGKDVSLPEYDFALRKIEQSFYDLKLGPES
jgi:regulator of replication initiation timing